MARNRGRNRRIRNHGSSIWSSFLEASLACSCARARLVTASSVSSDTPTRKLRRRSVRLKHAVRIAKRMQRSGDEMRAQLGARKNTKATLVSIIPGGQSFSAPKVCCGCAAGVSRSAGKLKFLAENGSGAPRGSTCRSRIMAAHHACIGARNTRLRLRFSPEKKL